MFSGIFSTVYETFGLMLISNLVSSLMNGVSLIIETEIYWCRPTWNFLYNNEQIATQCHRRSHLGAQSFNSTRNIQFHEEWREKKNFSFARHPQCFAFCPCMHEWWILAGVKPVRFPLHLGQEAKEKWALAINWIYGPLFANRRRVPKANSDKKNSLRYEECAISAFFLKKKLPMVFFLSLWQFVWEFLSLFRSFFANDACKNLT